ncbi:MAG: thioredoxin domain-containing protein [Phycisphaerales bacterium]|nr:thioredoxin domain-containing protein [Phycisphaerales bacterium]
MTDASGAFWSAQDAEVDAREGKSYLWSPQEVRQVLGESPRTDQVLAFYGLDGPANFQDPHHASAPAGWVLHQPRTLSEFTASAGVKADEWQAALVSIDELLLKHRNQRKQPMTDDKVLTSWNALAIRGLALAGQVLGDTRYVDAAGRACEALLQKLRDQEGGLLRSMRRGRAKPRPFWRTGLR